MSDTSDPPPDRATFAPTGALRAAINLGNAVLARRDAASATVVGVSVDLAAEFARRLGVPLELVVVPKAIQSVEAVTEGRADIGFFAIDPARGESIGFTAPYVLIEGCYLVAQSSPLQHPHQVDRPGTRVVVGQGSAYDLFLTRELGQAEIVRAPSSQDVVPWFVERGLEVAAGVRQQLEADAAERAGLRLLPGRFMVIEQAMGLSRTRGEAARQTLAAFVEEMKAGGSVAAALARHRVEGVSVAPPA